MNVRCAPTTISVVVLLFTVPSAFSQPLPDTGCQWGTAIGILEANNVRAKFFNHGASNRPWNVFEVPKDSSRSNLFAWAFWIGGKVDGDVRIAHSQYWNHEFFPGPLDENGDPPTDCTEYDHIYSITTEDIRRYDEAGDATDDLLNWPWDLGAEVVDGDGVPDNYNLSAGDRPRLIGNQTLFWVMNDAANIHASDGTDPIEIEVRATAFAFNSWIDAINNSIFVRYQLIYRGSTPLEEAYVGFWADAHSEWQPSGTEMAGADTTLDMGYTYKWWWRDRPYEGEPQPANGIVLLEGPTVDVGGKRDTLGMTGFMEIRPVDDGPLIGDIQK